MSNNSVRFGEIIFTDNKHYQAVKAEPFMLRSGWESPCKQCGLRGKPSCFDFNCDNGSEVSGSFKSWVFKEVSKPESTIVEFGTPKGQIAVQSADQFGNPKVFMLEVK